MMRLLRWRSERKKRVSHRQGVDREVKGRHLELLGQEVSRLPKGVRDPACQGVWQCQQGGSRHREGLGWALGARVAEGGIVRR